ncbi:MAG: Gfo/Idh/MocA family protein [Bradymonadaceae bacterium]
MSRLRVGIVAGESTPDRQLEPYRNDDRTRLTAVCDRDEERALRRSLDLEGDAYFTDYQQMLAEADLDAVDIRGIQSARANRVLRALDEGLHVRVAAPVAVDMETAQRVADAGRQSRGVLQVDEPTLFHRPLLDARNLIDSGEVGRPTDVDVQVEICSSSDPAWDFSRLSPDDWRFRADDGVSPLLLSTSHRIFGIAQFLVGSFEKLQVWRSTTRVGDGLRLDAPTRAMWKHHQRDCYGTLSIRRAKHQTLETPFAPVAIDLEISGPKGDIAIARTSDADGTDGAVELERRGQTIVYDRAKGAFEESIDSSAGNFIDACLGHADPLLGPSEAHQLAVLALAFHESAEQGRTVTLQHG